MNTPRKSPCQSRSHALGVISDRILGLVAVLAVAAGAWWASNSAAEKAVLLPRPAYDAPSTAMRETAVFAGGCFWGVQAVFQHTAGVLGAVSGYAGGLPQDANYALVSGGQTGHAEAVQVTFDPRQVSYGRLLQIYFAVAHDPTQLNRQGPDFGPQYRSALFFQGDAQRDTALRYIAQLEGARAFPAKIVTELAPLTAFHPAEAYHQDYAARNPSSPYIVAFDRPKIDNLRKLMPDLYRETPVLTTTQSP
ncbi:MAG TPA: peptide-methionine (S)-S-oxide reductase MsrA [Ramlibacter sp.]|nr:peptide-methionine (S)-S-oxide reductase MsrA [Ramlibacter sp.]